MIKFLQRSATVLLATLALTAQAAPAQPSVVRIGVASPLVGSPPSFTLGGLGVAYTKGWVDEELKKQGIKVEWTFFKGAGPAVNEAVTNKQLDFALQGDLPSIVARSVGLKTRIIAMTQVRSAIYLATPPGSSIKSVKDLKGKRVAIFLGTNSQLPVDRVLAANGLSEKDLRVVNLDTGSMDAAIASKSIDAAFGDIDLLALRDRGLAQIVYTTRGVAPEFTRQSALLVTDDFANQYPEATTAVVRGILRGARWVADPANEGELYPLWARMGFGEKILRESFSGDTLKAQFSPLLDDFAVARYKDAAAQTLQLKLARAPIQVEPWFDRRFLNEALKQSQLQAFWQPVDAHGKPAAAQVAGK